MAQMVWSHISDGFQQHSTTSDGLDPSALQKKESPRVSWTPTVKKDLDLLGLTWDEALDLTRDRSEWRDCTARCAFAARGRTKV